MRIAIVSDACDPPTNGVSTTLGNLCFWLRRLGHEVRLIAPAEFPTVPCPRYPEIRLAVLPRRRLARLLDAYDPDALHIATEGPLGLAARAYCVRRGRPFTTMFTTKFPEALQAHFGLPPAFVYALMRWFHGRSSALMVATPSLREELAALGFRNLEYCSRGVDIELFRPRPEVCLPFPRPIHLYVGRIALEKNIEAFLDLDLPGSKVLVGDGPILPRLRSRYPEAHFVGTRRGEALARFYAGSDLFVFPSRTDTFGLVVLEALACGLPVAAYPVTGPRDIIGDSGAGILDEDLGRAVRQAAAIPRALCRRRAESFSWEACARQFASLLRPIGRPAAARHARLGPAGSPGHAG